jgi:imidazolonepropionase
MQFVISVALTQMKMKIEQAIVASTYNAAYSLDLHNRKGMIDLDMDADILVMDVKDYREIGYYFGDNLNKMTIKNGEIVYEKTSSF